MLFDDSMIDLHLRILCMKRGSVYMKCSSSVVASDIGVEFDIISYFSYFYWKVNFNDVCGYASVDHNLCTNQLRTLEDKVHRLTQSVMLEKMKDAYDKHGKGSSRHIYFGTTDGYFLGYPADRPPEDETMCNCTAFDPRYR